MNYEQKYKEALEIAKDMMSYKEVRREDMEYIFPELKESTDEGIRESIAGFLKTISSLKDGQTLSNEDFDTKVILEWVAWLKKQGEQKPAEWHIEDEQNLNACLGYIPDELLRRWLKDVIHAKYDKSVDNVEPKFKVGDWVILTVGELSTTLQITNVDINKKLYWFNDDDGSYLPFVDEECLHLWTIEDAKDGDVLCTYECGEPKIVFIFKNTFKKISKKHCALSYYCYYSIMRHYFVPDSVTGCLGPNVEDIKPATKEQRDNLFSNIKESGYEWDKDKKELSGIR